MSNGKIVSVGGVARPAPAFRRRLGILGVLGGLTGRHPGEVDLMLDDEAAVSALAKVLDEAMARSVSKDGRLDLKDMAAHVLRKMREDG